MAERGEAYIELCGITKTFGSVTANKNVNLSVKKGEIHALLGENGSGKSTLMNILSGVYQPDSGIIKIGGKERVFHSPADAIKAGIGMIYQHFKLVDVLTAKENIIAGQKGSLVIHGKKLSDEIRKTGEKYGLLVDPDQKVYNMSVSEKQTVEILKVIYKGADVLILDEPTAVLTPQETKILFQILRNMKQEGCAIIIITHKLQEVLDISDRVTVLRKGESVSTIETAEATQQRLTEEMVGRAISLDIERAAVDEGLKKEILSIENLTVSGSEKRRALKGVSFTLKSGEMLGVAGIAGSGQKELCEAIAGLQKVQDGKILFNHEDLVGLSPREIIKKGVSMSFVPEDRLGMGLVAGMDVVDNVLLKSYQKMDGLFIDRKKGKEMAEHIVDSYHISTPGVFQIVKKLSGGNIQKVLLGREIDLAPQLLITAYPVRGLDIGASYNIYDLLNEQKKKGVGILFIGEDLDVLLALCDRIMVLHDGEIMGIYPAQELSKEEIGLMMMGKHREEGERVG